MLVDQTQVRAFYRNAHMSPVSPAVETLENKTNKQKEQTSKQTNKTKNKQTNKNKRANNKTNI